MTFWTIFWAVLVAMAAKEVAGWILAMTLEIFEGFFERRG